MSRGRFILTHLVATLLLLATFLAIALIQWYPHPYDEIESIHQLLSIIALLVVVLGPGLSFVLFKPGKRGLWYDLLLIFVLQSGFFTAAIWHTYRERPTLLLFSIDRFITLRDDQFDPRKLDPTLTLAEHGPSQLYVAPPSSDAERAELVQQWAFEGGVDFTYAAERYRNYHPHLNSVLARELDIVTAVTRQPQLAAAVEEKLQQLGMTLDQLAFLPLESRGHFVTAIIDRHDGKLLGQLKLDPWDSGIMDSENE
ncbi:hypothetical protein BOW53_05520 [Solemya pervernicosa gill symbiont]|uniref:Type IV pilin accessory protein n=2 Tax=Gammaproteobacteria incertae sedis TaxID=118884 RepID=A0A1T2L7A4_9GAMM|nr:hypothetical protein [Candidatus Reidiella endopervernicosa]OOZ40985.1 hypothetical protein BOW53_05520 [Solemya pervernicosa gill symbiont]QKQ25038.1 hypothetical protein HUE57_01100 [Candidatus Reidiella endopervernicosa]